jgi:hypothetical protein
MMMAIQNLEQGIDPIKIQLSAEPSLRRRAESSSFVFAWLDSAQQCRHPGANGSRWGLVKSLKGKLLHLKEKIGTCRVQQVFCQAEKDATVTYRTAIICRKG